MKEDEEIIVNWGYTSNYTCYAGSHSEKLLGPFGRSIILEIPSLHEMAALVDPSTIRVPEENANLAEALWRIEQCNENDNGEGPITTIKLGKGVHDLFSVLFPRSYFDDESDRDTESDIAGSMFAYLKHPLTLIGEDLNDTIIQGGSLKKMLMKSRTESNRKEKEEKEEKDEKEEETSWKKPAREKTEDQEEIIMKREKDFVASLPTLNLLTFQNLTIQEVPEKNFNDDKVLLSLEKNIRFVNVNTGND